MGKSINNLLFTISGIRGIVGEELNEESISKIVKSYCLWLKEKGINEFIIGKDTRPSSSTLEGYILKVVSKFGFTLINLGVCPTPIILYTNKALNISGGIVISGSHNSQKWNALKLLSENSFVCDNELEEIKNIYRNFESNSLAKIHVSRKNKVRKFRAVKNYTKALKKIINFKSIKRKNNLSVIIDTGAGAGKHVTPKILKKLGCSVKVINNELVDGKKFPRNIEPIEKNLHDLIENVWKEKSDIGFAHDSDADRLSIVGDDYKCYSEDTSLAIILHHFLKELKKKKKKIKFVTNVASSLMFERLAEQYGAKVIRTPIGECYVAQKLIKQLDKTTNGEYLILGGEASCGGIMFPEFNNARDGILAAAKIVEILVETQKKVSELVNDLPKYYSHRITLDIKNRNIEELITQLKEELIGEGEKVAQLGLDLRFGHGSEWFVLIHPSTTERKLRIISEAKRSALAKLYCETTLELIKLIESR